MLCANYSKFSTASNHTKYCKECKGTMICEHNKDNRYCKECEGTTICEHNTDKRYCNECGGTKLCEHNKDKRYCADCGGNIICKASKEPYHNGCRTSGNHKYHGFCVFCYIHIHPNDPKSITAKSQSKELQTMIYVCNKYEGFI